MTETGLEFSSLAMYVVPIGIKKRISNDQPFLFSFIGQDLQDDWDFFHLQRDIFRPKALLSK